MEKTVTTLNRNLNFNINENTVAPSVTKPKQRKFPKRIPEPLSILDNPVKKAQPLPPPPPPPQPSPEPPATRISPILPSLDPVFQELPPAPAPVLPQAVPAVPGNDGFNKASICVMVLSYCGHRFLISQLQLNKIYPNISAIFCDIQKVSVHIRKMMM